jgi:hypothetical protein
MCPVYHIDGGRGQGRGRGGEPFKTTLVPSLYAITPPEYDILLSPLINELEEKKIE